MSLKPRYSVKSNQVLELQRGNPVEYIYYEKTDLPLNASGTIQFSNIYGQTLDTWSAYCEDGVLSFRADSSDSDLLATGTAWALKVDYDDGENPRLREQGTVIRAEAPWPNAPATSDIFQGVQYNYSFGTPGQVVDPAWTILLGKAQVYDNSEDSKPNAVAIGESDSGTFDDTAMLYYAPLRTNAVRFTYSTVAAGNGDAWVVINSNYDGTNFAAIHHKQTSGTDYVAICTGSGPVTITDRSSEVTHTMDYETFTAEYNPSSNTYSVYVGASTTPLVSWTDSTNIVHHGNGYRYVGFGFKSASSGPGPEIAGWYAADSIGA
ncbi:MAG: hypothetical protein A4E20_10925 [Nitrospira sp. SG-bin2]|uniref:hypothetical protein n=1 Tax=Nitrospira cf. moscoviensis SBR1015 TaxID=96242 RepID=UPI000A09F8B9|nr:hypothetical protein [Nitrospira cf. moscoviensis SBR1015]OQW34525.1 MAG: hypothetical protein A4E20_10925 [Nitrospira sp. SG-bin2]